MTLRKVTQNGDRKPKPVLSNVRLPDAHYQPGDVAEVVFEGAVGTIRPKTFTPCDCANCKAMCSKETP